MSKKPEPSTVELAQAISQVEWTTDELTRDFTVLGFCAPFVVVVRKSDNVKGSLEFTHMPRKYFNFMPDEDPK